MHVGTLLSEKLLLRVAHPADVPALVALVRTSLCELGQDDYSHAQLAHATDQMAGIDRQLIADGTLFVVEAPDGTLAASGGWSRRAQLYGPATDDGTGSLLDPRRDAARLRMFFVAPPWVRRGLGRLLLRHCEQAAWDAGFRRVELAATRMGARLYASCGYAETGALQVQLAPGLTIEGLHMVRELTERPVT